MTTGATPSKEELVEMAKTDLAKFNQLRQDNPRLKIDLSNADLQGASLKDANLGNVNLSGTDLRRADLTNANLHRANLNGADLRDSTLGAFTGEPCMRMCLHESSFKNAHIDKSRLEEILAIINLNGDWDIKYELVAKK